MKKHFITGLVIILPLVLTVLILTFILNFLTRPFEGIAYSILEHFHLLHRKIWVLSSTEVLLYLSRFLVLATLFAVTVLLGYIAHWVFVHELIRFNDWIFHRIPLINRIYKASKETVTTLLSKESRSFKQVVLVPFPNTPGLSLGLVTSDALPEASHPRYQGLISVFIPGTPNPTVGFLLFFRPDQITPLTISVEEALKTIISCGVMIPQDQGNPEAKR